MEAKKTRKVVRNWLTPVKSSRYSRNGVLSYRQVPFPAAVTRNVLIKLYRMRDSKAGTINFLLN